MFKLSQLRWDETLYYLIIETQLGGNLAQHISTGYVAIHKVSHGPDEPLVFIYLYHVSLFEIGFQIGIAYA